MKKIPQYTLEKHLGSSPKASVYKGHEKSHPEKHLFLKIFDRQTTSSAQKQYFGQKIEHLKVLDDQKFLIPKQFIEQLDSCLIITDYFEGAPLSTYLEENPKIDIHIFLKIATQLCELIEEIHQSGIIHGGIKPHNILFNEKDNIIKLTDFISPLDIRNVSHFIYNAQFVRDTLAYTSPEQTGRINHRVEFTTDIYSLGVVFYELLTHQLPYYSPDPLELIHCHLAENPPEIKKNHKNVPEGLCNIIYKMLCKEPEKRYQKASGLLSDLKKLQEKILKEEKETNFSLGLNDYSHRVTFISKMVGRDDEAAKILKEYDLSSSGNFRSAFISGFSGIGKTRLIQELQAPIVRSRGYFTSGKFDVYQKNIPYSSLIQSFRNLVRTFLTESDSRLKNWKEKISHAVGGDGSVLTDVVPELTLLIGECPKLPELPPVEARNRFNRVFGDFLKALASKDSPLVLFIDDLQWCDVASFEFLTNIFMNKEEYPYLLLLGAYRHNEVDSEHPLCKMIAQVKENKIEITEISLGPILPQYCHEMISYILDAPLAYTESLSHFLSELTQGNPLFVSESLSYLYNEGLLKFDEKQEEWKFDIQEIKHSNMPQTIVDLFGKKVGRIEDETLDLLEYSSCMGNTFTPNDVSAIKNITLLETFQKLRPALEQGLLVENKNQLQFVHDKVQEATLSKIDKNLREQIHWEIANYLISAIPKNSPLEHIENIFTISSHINLACELTVEIGKKIPEDRINEIIKINYASGISAINSLATIAANDYFKKAASFLQDNSWEVEYHLTYNVHQKLAKTELMVGDYDSSEKLLETLLENAKTDLDKAMALSEQTTSLSSIGNFKKAIETANRGLTFFDQDLPQTPEEARKKCEELMKEIHDGDDDVWTKILNMPFTKERKSKIELSFYSEMIPDLYMSGMPDHLYLSAAQSTKLCLSGGMDESVIYSFSIMGLNLGEKLNFELAEKYQNLAINLSLRHPNTFGATRGINGVVWCNMHSRSRPTEIADYCLKGIQSGKNCGDLYNAGLCYGPLMWNLQVEGKSLLKIEELAEECFNFSKKFQLLFSQGLAEAVIYGLIKPMKKEYVPEDISQKVAKWENDNHVASAGSYYVLLGISQYYCEDYIHAEESLTKVEDYLLGLTDNVLKRQWYIFRALNAIQLYKFGLKRKDAEELAEFVEPILEKVERWSALGPLLGPYLTFLKAEYLSVEKPFLSIIEHYIKSAEAASQEGYTFLQAQIYQKIGQSLHLTSPATSKIYLQESLGLFRQCKAERKVFHILDKHPELFNHQQREEELVQTFHGTQGEETNPQGLLDSSYFFKAMLAISEELEIRVLLMKIMDVVLESSGAHSGSIVARNEDKLVVMASRSIESKTKFEVSDIDLEDADFIPKTIIRYVERTHEVIFSKNALDDERFSGDEEVKKLNLRSILCLPLLRKDKLVGVLYLENKLNSTVFSSQQIETTSLLSNQVAISIENALLLYEMKKAETKIKNSLHEKEILLQEIHHRVKNNLQIISSLLRLQSRNSENSQPKAILREAQNRIQSMALLHDRLYQSKNFQGIDLKKYVEILVSSLINSYALNGEEDNAIHIGVDVEQININFDKAISIGIILNEVVTNAIKYAFKNSHCSKNLIQIKFFMMDDSIAHLIVSDNGRGMPENFDSESKKTLGLQLISTLTDQIDSQYEFKDNGGVEFHLYVPTVEPKRNEVL